MPRGLILLLLGGSALAVQAVQPSLTPPAEQPTAKPAPAPAALAPASTLVPAVPSVPEPPASTGSKAGDSLPFHHDEADIPDSIGAITVRPVPDTDEPEPEYLKQVDYYRAHHDDDMAASYLEKVAVNPSLPAQDRAQAILVLADALETVQRRGGRVVLAQGLDAIVSGPPGSRSGGVSHGRALHSHGANGAGARFVLPRAIQRGESRPSAGRRRLATLCQAHHRHALGPGAQRIQIGRLAARAAELFDRFQHEAQTPPPGETRARAIFSGGLLLPGARSRQGDGRLHGGAEGPSIPSARARGAIAHVPP